MNGYASASKLSPQAAQAVTLATVPDFRSIAAWELANVSGELHDALLDDIARIFRVNCGDLTKITYDLLRIMEERKLISPCESADIVDIVDIFVRHGASFALTRAHEAQAKLMNRASDVGVSDTTPGTMALVIINVAVHSLKRTGSPVLPARISWGDIGGAIIGGLLGAGGGPAGAVLGGIAGGVLGSTLIP